MPLSERVTHLQKLTGHHCRVLQATSLHTCGLFLAFLSDFPGTPGVSQGKLGSVCLGQTDLVLLCVGIQLPHAQAVPAHTHEVKSCLPVGVLWPCCPKRELIRML